MGALVRQSGAWSDRIPVRHPATAHQGKPDSGGMEGADDESGGRRRPAPQILVYRFLQLRSSHAIPPRAGGVIASHDLLPQGRAWRHRKSVVSAKRRYVRLHTGCVANINTKTN